MNNQIASLSVFLFFTIAFSSLFSGMEAGLFSVNRLKIQKLARSGNKNANTLLRFLDNSENFYWIILIGNTLTNFLAVCFAVLLLHFFIGTKPFLFWLVFSIFVFVLYCIGDLLPKMLFKLKAESMCLAFAPLFKLISLSLSPLASVLSVFGKLGNNRAFSCKLFENRDELRLLMQESAKDLTAEERSMINRVMDFQSLRVRHITIPLQKAVSVKNTDTISKVYELAKKNNFTRLIVLDASNRVCGVVSLKTLLYRADIKDDQPVAEFIQPALYISEELWLRDAFRKMQKSGQRLAIVLDKNLHEVGIISFQDILRAIFGELNL